MYFRKPNPATIRHFLTAQSGLAFTYPDVGATASSTAPSGFKVDHTRIRLGAGEPVFRTARAALERWEQFRLGWVDVAAHDTPIRAGEVVSMFARAMGVWWLNACRIVYVIDEPRRFGFGYGTLPGHVESGEERFTIDWDPAGDSVHYDIFAFSRPRHVLARLAYPFARRCQKRFTRDSAARMLAVTPTGPVAAP